MNDTLSCRTFWPLTSPCGANGLCFNGTCSCQLGTRSIVTTSRAISADDCNTPTVVTAMYIAHVLASVLSVIGITMASGKILPHVVGPSQSRTASAVSPRPTNSANSGVKGGGTLSAAARTSHQQATATLPDSQLDSRPSSSHTMSRISTCVCSGSWFTKMPEPLKLCVYITGVFLLLLIMDQMYFWSAWGGFYVVYGIMSPVYFYSFFKAAFLFFKAGYMSVKMIQMKEGQQSLPREVKRMRRWLRIALALHIPGAAALVYLGVFCDSISFFGMRVCIVAYTLSFIIALAGCWVAIYRSGSLLLELLGDLIAKMEAKNARKVVTVIGTRSNKSHETSRVTKPSLSRSVPVSSTNKDEAHVMKKEAVVANGEYINDIDKYRQLQRFHTVYLRLICFVIVPFLTVVNIFFIVFEVGPLFWIHALTIVEICGALALVPIVIIIKG